MRTLTTILLVTVLAGALAAACGDSGNGNGDLGAGGDMTMEVKPDLSMTAQPDMAAACFTNPTSGFELLNACTNADFVDKMPFYPTLAPNGQLPPLQ